MILQIVYIFRFFDVIRNIAVSFAHLKSHTGILKKRHSRTFGQFHDHEWIKADSIQTVLTLPLCDALIFQYFRTLNTRVSVVYIETWQGTNQAPIDKSEDISRALLNFNDYTSRKLFKVDKDTTQLLTWVHNLVFKQKFK